MMPITNVITLPQDVLDRVARVLDYHEETKNTHESVKAAGHQKLDPLTQPYEFRVFEMLPRVCLAPNLLDVGVGALALMEQGLAAVPASQVPPPYDLKTLATWLQLRDSLAQRRPPV